MAKPTIKHTKLDPSRVSYLQHKDLYKRAIGKMEDGNPKVFYLGSDETEAKQRSLKLDMYWREIVAKGQELWSEDTLEVAFAIAKGKKRATLSPTYGSLHVDGVDPYQTLTDQIDSSRIERAESKVIPVVVKQPIESRNGGSTFHDVITAFANHIRKTYVNQGTTTPSPYGVVLAAQVERLADSHPDIPLGQWGYTQLEDMTQYWKNRPCRKGTEKPISTETVKDQVKALRRLVKWTSKHYQWRKPEDWIDATKIVVKNLKTKEEKAAKATARQVSTYTVDELSQLYPFATETQRTLLVLALNCAFGAGEISTLRMNEVHIVPNGKSYIRRIRTKTGVYGEHYLWPETAELLADAMARRQGVKPTDLVFVRRGTERPLVSQAKGGATSNKCATLWNFLLKKIRQEQPDFRALSFNKLRKTGANLVRQVADGETSRIHLHHGQSVEGDELAEVYTDRHFEKLFEAQAKVRATLLAPMFAQPTSARGEEQGKRVRDLAAKGVNVGDIAKELGISQSTVYRHLENSTESSPRPK